MDFIQKNDKILLVWDNSFDLQSSKFNTDNIKSTYDAAISFEHIDRLSLGVFPSFFVHFCKGV